ncbi:GAF domain-containing protein [Pseudolysinimonas sp.]|uniref:GAF domain-containing sensor histidine kinase n=1 Tax=Pseudolysinimonas sp. TaxID=2680009 RepID=UPI003F7D6D60
MASVEEIGFPDTPRSELERTIEELVERAQQVLRTQGRLRSLLHANRVVVERLEIEEVLRRIVEAAVDLVDARYGALGVIGVDGGLERFIHVGMSEDDARLIGHLPEGRGVLGAVIREAAPIRLEHLRDDPRSSRFPPHHPAMDAFMGVPVHVGDRVFGNLYLTEPHAGRFTNEDQELVGVLAATAGVAIENARLYEEVRERERWTAALADVTSAFLSAESDPLSVVVERIAELVDADLSCVIVPQADGALRVAAARGSGADEVRGRVYGAESSLAGEVMRTHESVVSASQPADVQFPGQPALGPTLVVPLITDDQPIGALSISRPMGAAHFSTGERLRATEFAFQASIALRIAQGRLDQQELERIDDRSRIARDLHDHVIQRLFAAGLAVQAEAARAEPGARDRLTEQVAAIDTAISEIRTVIFALSSGRTGVSLRHRILDVVGEIAPAMHAPPHLSFSGAVDLVVPLHLVDDVVAVVRESLTNVVRHAHARSTSVDVRVDGSVLTVTVTDDGVGIPPDVPRSGTANLISRAHGLGGSCDIRPGDGGGTVVTWSIPVHEEAAP